MIGFHPYFFSRTGVAVCAENKPRSKEEIKARAIKLIKDVIPDILKSQEKRIEGKSFDEVKRLFEKFIDNKLYKRNPTNFDLSENFRELYRKFNDSSLGKFLDTLSEDEVGNIKEHVLSGFKIEFDRDLESKRDKLCNAIQYAMGFSSGKGIEPSTKIKTLIKFLDRVFLDGTKEEEWFLRKYDGGEEIAPILLGSLSHHYSLDLKTIAINSKLESNEEKKLILSKILPNEVAKIQKQKKEILQKTESYFTLNGDGLFEGIDAPSTESIKTKLEQVFALSQISGERQNTETDVLQKFLKNLENEINENTKVIKESFSADCDLCAIHMQELISEMSQKIFEKIRVKNIKKVQKIEEMDRLCKKISVSLQECICVRDVESISEDDLNLNFKYLFKVADSTDQDFEKRKAALRNLKSNSFWEIFFDHIDPLRTMLSSGHSTVQEIQYIRGNLQKILEDGISYLRSLKKFESVLSEIFQDIPNDDNKRFISIGNQIQEHLDQGIHEGDVEPQERTSLVDLDQNGCGITYCDPSEDEAHSEDVTKSRLISTAVDIVYFNPIMKKQWSGDNETKRDILSRINKHLVVSASTILEKEEITGYQQHLSKKENHALFCMINRVILLTDKHSDQMKRMLWDFIQRILLTCKNMNLAKVEAWRFILDVLCLEDEKLILSYMERALDPNIPNLKEVFIREGEETQITALENMRGRFPQEEEVRFSEIAEATNGLITDEDISKWKQEYVEAPIGFLTAERASPHRTAVLPLECSLFGGQNLFLNNRTSFDARSDLSEIMYRLMSPKHRAAFEEVRGVAWYLILEKKKYSLYLDFPTDLGSDDDSAMRCRKQFQEKEEQVNAIRKNRAFWESAIRFVVERRKKIGTAYAECGALILDDEDILFLKGVILSHCKSL